MDFENRFKRSLKQKIAADDDKYTELQYSDSIYVHVASHLDGEGAFELYAIVPHDALDDPSIVGRDGSSQLPYEVPDAEQFYDEVEQYIEDVIGRELVASELTFHQLEVVDDGAWEHDATSYCTHKLTVER